MQGSRALKSQVRQILSGADRQKAFAQISCHRPRRVINALISQFYDADEILRWRAIAVAGRVVADLAESDRESARVIMRRLMWMLNDESGGIGWGAPEAMGEITALSPAMADEYSDILCSYIYTDQNFLEHPGLQQGLLWGLGRLAQSAPARVKPAIPDLLPFLESRNHIHRGFSAWAVGNTRDPSGFAPLQKLFSDKAEIVFFEQWHIRPVSVGELARQAADMINQAKEES